MSVEGTPVFHLTDDSKVPGRIIERKPVKVFSFKMCLVEEQFEMVHYVEPGKKPRWGYFPKEGHPEVVTKFEGTKATPEFLQAIAYEVYVKNVTFGLLHQWLTDLGMTISANTLHNWLKKGKKYLDQLIVVLKSIALEKDSIVNCNELKSTQFKDTEHQICMAHSMAKFAKAANPGGDEGVEMAAAYHSVISTVKLHGMSSWHFLGEFFQKVFSGCRDFLSLTPLNIGLAYSKC